METNKPTSTTVTDVASAATSTTATATTATTASAVDTESDETTFVWLAGSKRKRFVAEDGAETHTQLDLDETPPSLTTESLSTERTTGKTQINWKTGVQTDQYGSQTQLTPYQLESLRYVIYCCTVPHRAVHQSTPIPITPERFGSIRNLGSSFYSHSGPAFQQTRTQPPARQNDTRSQKVFRCHDGKGRGRSTGRKCAPPSDTRPGHHRIYQSSSRTESQPLDYQHTRHARHIARLVRHPIANRRRNFGVFRDHCRRRIHPSSVAPT